jgi:hypothetical protein
MTTLREKVIKIGAKVVGHARYVTGSAHPCALVMQLPSFDCLSDRRRPVPSAALFRAFLCAALHAA